MKRICGVRDPTTVLPPQPYPKALVGKAMRRRGSKACWAAVGRELAAGKHTHVAVVFLSHPTGHLARAWSCTPQVLRIYCRCCC